MWYKATSTARKVRKPYAFFHGHFRVVVHSLDGTGGHRSPGSEPVEQQVAMCPERTHYLLDGSSRDRVGKKLIEKG